MVEEYRSTGEGRYQDLPSAEEGGFRVYIRHLEDMTRGAGLPPGYVPTSTFWLLRGGTTIIGVGRLRHRLTPDLEHEGGHIGYDIRPLQRRKGYGTRLLALVLERARAFGLERVLLTCDSDNTGSARIIQKNGGVLAGQAISRRTGKLISRYWIDL
jgi:predicted acetyltransferase